MATKRRRIAVVGAGVGGLASIKSCLEEGLEVVAFESRPTIGGLWSGVGDGWNVLGPRMYRTLMSNTSKSMTCFSDFPYPAYYPPFPPYSMVLEYLESYAHHFNLMKHIKFNVRVLKVVKSNDHDISGRWTLTLTKQWKACEENGENRSMESDNCQEKVSWEEAFDGVIVAAGFYSKAKSPNYPGIESKFSGVISHSCSYEDSAPYKSKTVLVIGNQHTAFDIACDLADHSKQVYLSVGDGVYLRSRVSTTGLPGDLNIARVQSYLTRAQRASRAARLAMSRFDHRVLGLHQSRPTTSYPIVINDTVHIKINCGTVKAIGRLKEFNGSSVTTRAGQTIEGIDHIIFATGYEKDLSFLDQSLNLSGDKVDLYKQVFPVFEKQHTLALVGFIKIAGPMPPSIELQARLAAYTLSGRHTLPPPHVMEEDSARYTRMAKRADGSYRYEYSAITIMEELATEIGVTPRFWKLVFQGKPSLAFKTFFGPATPCVYRLMGPGSWPGAESAILRAVEENRKAINSSAAEEPKGSGQSFVVKAFLLLGTAAVLRLLYPKLFSKTV